jgi:flagellar hook-length control protein FliK
VTAPAGLGIVVESVRQASPRQVVGAQSQQPIPPVPPQAHAQAQPASAPYSPMIQAREPAVFEAMRYEALRRNPATKEQIGRAVTPDFAPVAAISVAPGASPVAAGAALQSTPAPVVYAPSSTDINLFSEGWENKLTELVDYISSTSQGTGDSLTVVRLSPEHLGDLEIGVTMKDGEVDVSFAASVAETRAALEQALPKLRELLGQSGLELSNASVFSNLSSGSERRQGSLADAPPLPVGSEDRAQSDDEPYQDGVNPSHNEQGGVDLYV